MEEENKSKLSVLDETKAAIEELKKEKEEISKVRDDIRQLKSEQLLSGTAGGHIEPEPPKPLTSKEYADAVMSGKIKPQ